jgi:hypothetical protein
VSVLRPWATRSSGRPGGLWRGEDGQGLLVVLALVGLVSAVAYGYMALVATANQQSTLRATQLAEHRAGDGGAIYAMWYAGNKGFPPSGALTPPDPGDGNGAPTVTLTDLRPELSFAGLHRLPHGPRTYDSVAHDVAASGDVFFTFTWTSDRVGAGLLGLSFTTTPIVACCGALDATVLMPPGETTTTSTVTLPAVSAGTYYLHVQNLTPPGPDNHLSSSGTFRVNYPGARFQAIAVRSGRTSALDAGLTRTGGVTFTAVVNSWTLR